MLNISYTEVFSIINKCKDWNDLYNLIEIDPELFDVHYCIFACNKELYCEELFSKLIQTKLLDVNQTSKVYNNMYMDDLNIKPKGQRTCEDYLRYLLNRSLDQNDIEFVLKIGRILLKFFINK